MTRTRIALLALLTLVTLGLHAATANAAKPPVVSPRGTSVSEGVGHAYVVLTLKAAAKKALHVPFATVAGTAKPGSDYRSVKGTATIKKGARSTRISIPIVNDRKAEATEAFTVKLTDGTAYNLATKTVTVTIKDNDGSGGSGAGSADAAIAKVHQWSGDLTIHVTKHQPSNPTTVDEDWTFKAHLVLVPDQYRSSWLPTAASTWTLVGSTTTTDPGAECAAHPDHKTFDATGTFMPNPMSGTPNLGQAQYSLRTQAGGKPNVIEAGIIHAAATYYTYWDNTHTCSEHVGDAEVTVGFQTGWRTSNPVAHPGTFPLTLHYGNGGTSLTVDFTDDWNESNHAGWTTHSRVTGTLHGS